MTYVIIIIIWALAMVAGGIIGSNKNRRDLGLALALVLGWIGVLIIAFMPSYKPDPKIEAVVQEAARNGRCRKHAFWASPKPCPDCESLRSPSPE